MRWGEEDIIKDVCRLNPTPTSTTDTQIDSSETRSIALRECYLMMNFVKNNYFTVFEGSVRIQIWWSNPYKMWHFERSITQIFFSENILLWWQANHAKSLRCNKTHSILLFREMKLYQFRWVHRHLLNWYFGEGDPFTLMFVISAWQQNDVRLGCLKVIHFSTLPSSFSSFWELITWTKLDITRKLISQTWFCEKILIVENFKYQTRYLINPIAYGILRLSQLRGRIFIPHPRKQCYNYLIDLKFTTHN